MSNNDQSSDDQGVESPWSRVWKYIKGQPTEVTRSIVVPTERVFDSGTMPNRFEPRKQYFGVGPSMIQAKGENVPAGMAITDTLVAGVHPYAGGKFALTVILAQVKRNS